MTHAEHLTKSLARLDLLLQRQILRLKAARLIVEDEFRGLYIPDEYAERLAQNATEPLVPGLDEIDRRLAECERAPEPESALGVVTDKFGLTLFEAEVLLLAAAPEFDLRYESLYAYVQNDVTKKRPTVDLALQLFCCSFKERLTTRAAFRPASTLMREGLIVFAADPQERDCPLPSRQLRVPAELADFLAGPTAESGMACASSPEAIFFEGPQGSGKYAAARAEAHSRGAAIDTVDLRTVDLNALPDPVALRRNACLHGALIYIAHWETIYSWDPRTRGAWIGAVRQMLRPSAPVLIGSEAAWHPGGHWPEAIFTRKEFGMPDIAERHQTWARALNGSAGSHEDLSRLAAHFAFTRGQIEAAVRDARHHAREGAVSASDLHEAARAQCCHTLARFGRKVRTGYEWDDLVLPDGKYSSCAKSCLRYAGASKCTADGASSGNSRCARASASCSRGRAGRAKRWPHRSSRPSFDSTCTRSTCRAS